MICVSPDLLCSRQFVILSPWKIQALASQRAADRFLNNKGRAVAFTSWRVMLPLPLQLIILFLVGALCGFINVLAGGGSLLTLPVLIFLGLPAAVANGTNRVAIMVQNLAAIAGFHRLRVYPWRLTLLASVPATLGAVLGAHLALDVSDRLFKQILAGIMVAVLLLLLWDPARRIRATAGPVRGWRLVLFLAGFFAAGVFGGFIQAGVGFVIIALMALTGFDLLATNAVKVMVVFVFTGAALAVFILHHQVDYLLGTALGLGSALGGVIGTQVGVKKGHGWIRGFVIVAVVTFAAKMFVDSLW